MSLKRSFIASALIILTVLCVRHLSHVENIPPKMPLDTFPTHIGEWVGKTKCYDKRIYDVLGVDDSFLCDYAAPDGREIELYIGFYESQRKGDIIHSPKHCMPGGGWNITKAAIEKLTTPGTNPGTIRINKLLLEKEGEKQIALYWFQSRGRFIASEYMQKIYLVIDSITKRRTDGSFVRLISPVKNGDEDRTSDAMKAFVEVLFPVLQAYLPS